MMAVVQLVQRSLVTIGLFLVMPSTAIALPTSAIHNITKLLPQSGTTAYVVLADSSKKMQLFQREVIKNEGNVTVLLNILRQYKGQSGKIPKYDRRLNISEERYKSYFQPHEISPSFKLPIVRTKLYIKFGDSPQLNQVFDGLKFNLKTGVLIMPEGFKIKAIQQKFNKNNPYFSDTLHFYTWDIYGLNTNPNRRNGVSGHVYLYQKRDGNIYLQTYRTSMINGRIKKHGMTLRYKQPSANARK